MRPRSATGAPERSTRVDARPWRFHLLTPDAASGLREMPVAFCPAQEGKHDRPDNDMRSAEFRLRGRSRSDLAQPAGSNRFRRRDTGSAFSSRALWSFGESRRSRVVGNRSRLSCHDTFPHASCWFSEARGGFDTSGSTPKLSLRAMLRIWFCFAELQDSSRPSLEVRSLGSRWRVASR